MLLPLAILVSQAPLTLKPGIRTYPEIAALLGETPTEVRCDPRIENRAAFVAAKAISREGLLKPLGLALAPDGKTKEGEPTNRVRKKLVLANTDDERLWADRLRGTLASRYARLIAAVTTAANAGPQLFDKGADENWQAPLVRVLNDPKSPPAERRRADDALLAGFARIVVTDFGDTPEASNTGEARALALALTAFPAEVPPALLSEEALYDTLPLEGLPPAARAALARAFPALRGGRDAVAVRRRRLFRLGAAVGIEASVGLADPGLARGFTFAVLVTAGPAMYGYAPSLTSALLRADAERDLPLPRFAEAVAARRKEEAGARALIEEWVKEAPLKGESLSQIAEAWAARGHDVVMELDPPLEDTKSVLPGSNLAPESDWSPKIVEGVLALRPLARFLDGPRRYPYAALRALEATGERFQGPTFLYGTTFPASEKMAEYVRLAGPGDRWGATNYRGWKDGVLDRAATLRRVRECAPPAMNAQADALVVRLTKENPTPPGTSRKLAPEPLGAWRTPLAQLSLKSQAILGEEMRRSGSPGSGDEANILAHSPAALALFLREGYLEITVRDTMKGYLRSTHVSCPDILALSGAGLNGE